MNSTSEIREARPDEWEALGELTARAYAELPDMPGPDVFPEYYQELRDVAGRAKQPGIVILVAAGSDGTLLGGVTFVADMKTYGVDEVDFDALDAAGIRMLAVDESARGRRLGRALTEACIRRAQSLDRAEVVLHTTAPMRIARGMYERIGFHPSPDLDFHPGGFTVMGFRLRL